MDVNVTARMSGRRHSKLMQGVHENISRDFRDVMQNTAITRQSVPQNMFTSRLTCYKNICKDMQLLCKTFQRNLAIIMEDMLMFTESSTKT